MVSSFDNSILDEALKVMFLQFIDKDHNENLDVIPSPTQIKATL